MQLLPSRVLLLPIMLCHKSNRCTHSTDADISNETYCVVLLCYSCLSRQKSPWVQKWNIFKWVECEKWLFCEKRIDLMRSWFKISDYLVEDGLEAVNMFPSNKFIPISFHRLLILLCAFETRTFGREGWWGRHNIAKKLILMSCCLLFLENVGANHDAKLLYDDLLSSYNRYVMKYFQFTFFG